MKAKDKVLQDMLDEIKEMPEEYAPSDYWDNINKKHIEHINKYGMRYFKRSLNKDYFDWGPTGIPYQLSHIFSEIRKGNLTPLISCKFIDGIPAWKPFYKYQSLSKFIYKIYVAYMYDYVRRIDTLGILKKFSEPLLGSPLLINYRNKNISQNISNSTLEFYSITKGINYAKQIEIAEIGAGYGRLAYVFLNALPKANYCIIDIPPALYISQEYLKKIFQKENFFFFKHFDKFSQVEKDFKQARIKFLMPHQITLLPKEYFDIIINISSFHEMNRKQIRNYIQQVDRLSSGYFYYKQWKKSPNKINNFIAEDEYPIPKNWQKIYHHTDPIHSRFFEALYKTR